MLLDLIRRLAAIALFAGTGLGLVVCVPSLRRASIELRAGYAYILGAAWIGGVSFVLSRVGVALTGTTVLVLALLPMTSGLIAARARRLRTDCRRRPPSKLLLAVICAGALISGALLIDALANPLTDWDGRLTWSTQARYMAAARSVSPPVLGDARTFISHPRYPPLLPLCQVAAIELCGHAADWDERCFRPLYAAFFPAFLCILFGSARRWAGVRAASLTTLAAALVPFLSFGAEGGAVSAYSDLPLACFWGAGLLLLARARVSLGEGIAGGGLLAAAVLTKNEGTPLALGVLVLTLCSTVPRRRGRTRTALAPFAAATTVVLGTVLLLGWWRSQIPNRFDEDYLVILRQAGSKAAVRGAIQHVVLISSLILDRLKRLETWAGLPILALALSAAGARAMRRPQARVVAAAVFLPLLIGLAAYSLHPDPAYLVPVTWDRMVLQTALPLFVWLSISMRAILDDATVLGSWPGRPSA